MENNVRERGIEEEYDSMNSIAVKRPKLHDTAAAADDYKDDDVGDIAAEEERPHEEIVEATCAICMEAKTIDNSIQAHQCSVCRADAWEICEVCNSALLSRACPFCKSDYAPMILYEVPGRPLSDVRSTTISEREKMILMIKIKALESLITAGNTLLWYPVPSSKVEEKKEGLGGAEDGDEEGVALFSLPRKFVKNNDGSFSALDTSTAGGNHAESEQQQGQAGREGVNPLGEDEVILISLSMNKSELRLHTLDGGIPDPRGEEKCCFDFVNKTWSFLEAAVEGDAEAGDETQLTGEDENAVLEPIAVPAASRASVSRAAVDVDVSNATPAESAKKTLRLAITHPKSRLFLPLSADNWEEMENCWRENVVVGHKR